MIELNSKSTWTIAEGQRKRLSLTLLKSLKMSSDLLSRNYMKKRSFLSLKKEINSYKG